MFHSYSKHILYIGIRPSIFMHIPSIFYAHSLYSMPMLCATHANNMRSPCVFHTDLLSIHGYSIYNPCISHAYSQRIPYICHADSTHNSCIFPAYRYLYSMRIPCMFHAYSLYIACTFHGYVICLACIDHGLGEGLERISGDPSGRTREPTQQFSRIADGIRRLRAESGPNGDEVL